ncbi:cupin domain-containing protein [Aliivibrio fischeri]|uniref:cupin domain-containing protein n=1 Tax=Aliivibrio fischeri TaxID=668 RepID=UPI00080EAC49|nr:cupin domain-containing protein [Aliivibrio fischeri]OCH38015.1 hypothetical protein A6D99_13000 [Aliivibrio fischeri]
MKIVNEIDIKSPSLLKVKFGDLLLPTDLDYAFNNTFKKEHVRLVTDGKDSYEHIIRKTHWYSTSEKCVSHSRLMEGLINGSMVILMYQSHLNRKISDLCKDIESSFSGHYADAHIFISGDNCKQSFPLHADQSHNLIIQVSGSQQVFVEQLGLIKLQSGDVLFIPQGYMHQVLTEGRRVSVSIPFICTKRDHEFEINTRSTDKASKIVFSNSKVLK